MTETTRRWCEWALGAGPDVPSSSLLVKDTAWLKAAGVPFVSRLLTDLAETTTRGQRWFDGTWAQGPDALVRVWLRLSEY